MHTPLVGALTELTKPWYRPGTDSPHEGRIPQTRHEHRAAFHAARGLSRGSGTSPAPPRRSSSGTRSPRSPPLMSPSPACSNPTSTPSASSPRRDTTPGPESSWGVFAAEIPGRVVTATPAADSTLVLYGEKAWCSLATELTHAIVSVRLGEARQTVAVDLTGPGVHPPRRTGRPSGSPRSQRPHRLRRRARATEVGPPEWYLRRPGFAWGGIRVAACWFGGALGLARNAPAPLRKAPGLTPGDDDAGTDRHGDHGRPHGPRPRRSARRRRRHRLHDDSWTQALRVRTIVYRACQRIQELSRELAGPAALTGDREFAKADADLTVYLSQHHGPRDEASLGEAIVADATPR
ncbi:hypothetical protein IOD13_19240 [Brevibacterium casei]|nr:hypothetical protein [Brevibacterium casei]